MVETAAHLVDHVFPWPPIRQWVLALPKRVRYFLHHDPNIATAVLHTFVRIIEAAVDNRQADDATWVHYFSFLANTPAVQGEEVDGTSSLAKRFVALSN